VVLLLLLLIHSFIHSSTADTYIAALRAGLLRSAPNPIAAEKCCFKLLKEFLGEDLETIVEPIGDHTRPKGDHGEGPVLRGGGTCKPTSKWDMKEALFSRAKVTGTPSAKGRPTQVRGRQRPGLFGSRLPN